VKNTIYLIITLLFIAFSAPSILHCQLIIVDDDNEPQWTMGVPWDVELAVSGDQGANERVAHKKNQGEGRPVSSHAKPQSHQTSARCSILW
jgi:hypothetical protein